jgi:hypothetical protein
VGQVQNDFWKFLLGAAAILAVVVGAAAVSWPEWVFIGIAVAFALSALYALRHRIHKAYLGITTYSRLLQQIGNAKSDLADRDRQVAELSASARANFLAGRETGRHEAFGWVKGSTYGGAMPKIDAVLVVGDDLVLVADLPLDEDLQGAWFGVEDEQLADLKGVVQVTLCDPETSSIHLTCVRPIKPSFWTKLKEMADVDSRPPPRIVLTRPPSIEVGDVLALKETQEETES